MSSRNFIFNQVIEARLVSPATLVLLVSLDRLDLLVFLVTFLKIKIYSIDVLLLNFNQGIPGIDGCNGTDGLSGLPGLVGNPGPRGLV